MPLIQAKHEEFTRQVEKLTCSIAISQGSQVSFLKAQDEAFVKTAIRLLVDDVLMHYGALERVSAPRLVNSILGKYWWMKLEEIAYVFNKGKNGGYSKHYGLVSESLFFDWLKEYDMNERENEMIEYNRRLQEERNKSQLLSDEQLKDFYKNSVGVDNSPSIPDGSKRMSELKKDEIEVKKEILKYSADPEAKKRNEELLKKLNGE